MLLDQWIPTWDTLAYPAGVCEKNQRCTPRINSINILHAGFLCADPVSAKRQSTHIKAAHKMLVKLTPGLNFITVLSAAFTLVDPKSVKRH